MNYNLYQGPSLLTGEPIVGVVSGVDRPSRNRKTGPMIQTWYMRSDIPPIDALQSGADEAICGKCPLRGINGRQRACYVTVAHAPRMIYNTIPQLLDIRNGLFRNRAVRLGSYGDPASIPIEAHRRILKEAILVTGYSHQWRTCDPEYSKILMASVSSEEEFEQAKAKGWKTFRVKNPDDPVLRGETICPASDEAGKVMSCIQCGRCNGQSSDVVINIHGTHRRIP